MTRQQSSGIVLAACACALFGGTWVAVKVAQSNGIPPLEFAALRALPAGLVLFALCVVLRRSLKLPRRADAAAVCSASLSTACFFGLTFAGAQRLPAGTSSLLGNCAPLFSVVLAWLVLRERVPLRNVAGVLIGALGVAVIAAPAFRSAAPQDVGAILAMLGGALALAFSVLALKRVAYLDPLLTNAYQFTGAGLALTLAAALATQLAPVPLRGPTLLAILYVSLAATTLGYILWTLALRSLPVSRASTLIFLVPIFGHVWSWLFLREPVDALELAGAGIALIGIALAAS